MLKGAGFPVVVRATLSRHNLHDLEALANLLLKEVGLAAFSTNEAFPMGAGCQTQGQISLTSPEKLQAIQTLECLLRRYPGPITAQAGPIAKLQMHAEMKHARRTGEKTPVGGWEN